MTTSYLAGDRGGTYVEWYRDDDGDSGYGDAAEVTRWYGPAEECRRLLGNEPPAGCMWAPVEEYFETPADHATATGMYDRW